MSETDRMEKLAHSGEQALGALMHKVVGGGGTKTFNESQVKRDGRGQFAKKSGVNLKNIDKFNEDVIDALMDEILKGPEYKQTFDKAMAEGLDAAGLPPNTKIEDIGSKAGAGQAFDEAFSDTMVGWANAKLESYPDKDGNVAELYVDKEGSPDWRVAKHDGMEGDEFLMHFGVKGMKWGVRKRRSVSELTTATGKLKEKQGVLKTKRSAAVTKRDTAIRKESAVQKKTLMRLAKGKKVGFIRRHKIRSVSRKTVRSIRQTNRIDRQLKRTESKISKLEKATVEAGRLAAEEMMRDD